MATKKKITKTVTPPTRSNFSPFKFLRLLAIVVLSGILIFGLVKKYRHLFIVGVVNTTPITRWQLDKVIFSRYGKTSLDEMVNVVLLEQLAKKNNVKIVAADIDSEIADLEKRLGGKEALKANMERFGVDETKLKEEVRSIVLQRKLSQKVFNVSITDEEVTTYYNQNKVLFDKKSLDEVKEEIKKSLEQQKSQEDFSKWFQDEKSKAKISLFI
jgi:parvulin-like peptidyl-prolyl isomerase